MLPGHISQRAIPQQRGRHLLHPDRRAAGGPVRGADRVLLQEPLRRGARQGAAVGRHEVQGAPDGVQPGRVRRGRRQRGPHGQHRACRHAQGQRRAVPGPRRRWPARMERIFYCSKYPVL